MEGKYCHHCPAAKTIKNINVMLSHATSGLRAKIMKKSPRTELHTMTRERELLNTNSSDGEQQNSFDEVIKRRRGYRLINFGQMRLKIPANSCTFARQ